MLDDASDLGDQLVRLTRDELAEIAADAAANNNRLTRRDRFLMFLSGMLTALLVSLAVGIPLGFYIHNNTEKSAKNNARYDCALMQQVGGILGKFVNGDATLREKQAKLSVTTRLLQDVEKIIPVQDLEASAAASLNLSTAAATRWKTQLLPPLDRLVNLDCRAALP